MRQILIGLLVVLLCVACATPEGGQPQQPVQPLAVTDAGGSGYFIGSIYGIPVSIKVDGGVVGEDTQECVGIDASVLGFQVKGALPLKGKAKPTAPCIEKHGGLLTFPLAVQGGAATNPDATP